MLAGWRGADGSKHGSGEPNPNQLERYIANGCFWQHEIPESQAYFRHANKDYLEWAVSMGFIDQPEPVVLQIYSEVLQKFRLAAEGHGAVQPPERDRPRIAAYFDPLPLWYRPLEQAAAVAARNSPSTPSPSGPWPCITPGARRMPGCARSTAPIACS